MVSRWKQQGAPLADHQALCKWLRINRQRMPKKLKDSIQRIERNACVRSQIKEIAEVLAAESSPSKLYEMLAPAILGGRIFEGLKVLTKSESQVKLPIWIVECFQSEGENYLQGIDLIDADS